MANSPFSPVLPWQHHTEAASLTNGPPTPPDELSNAQALATECGNGAQLPCAQAVISPLKEACSNEATSRSPTDVIRGATNLYFLEVWPFKTEKARTRYLLADLAGLACLCYPSAPDTVKLLLVVKLTAAACLIDGMTMRKGSPKSRRSQVNQDLSGRPRGTRRDGCC